MAVMTADDVVRALDALDAARVPIWLDGGWGVDALLGEQTRDHDDVDLVVGRADASRAATALAQLGYQPDASARPGLPARLVLRASRDRQVDLHPVLIDRHGHGWQSLGDRAWGWYDVAGLDGSGTVGGRPVRCVTAELQLRHRLGYPWRAVDEHDLGRLAERFDLPLPPA